MTDCIRNTKRELYDEMLDHELVMFDLEWSKNDDTKMMMIAFITFKSSLVPLFEGL